ncbi:RNA polymerase sigma factor (sigma-70 family) [Allocatelliglobosispora scoriae]|uniref:RNA polymerase sigma factor (Sigma-70 family) n=1 Tax=Allocatelliglobosispora scoriae TaxID=643052 RepID=A0A841BZD2_9ACTN|nr:sigma-70 family RNA polymerase sigma factor [Allocatelliglobosispora scoriae]MBB5872946.1 RNA polymerase sigma factor (sigma-70 family) [Allocatelliglobosispora scoriae]
MTLPESETAALLDRATKGDQQAWNALVDRYSGLVWSVARSYRLGSADAADVHQATWLRLVEHLGNIREPERLGAWLATTARREALAVLRRASRDLPVADLLTLEPRDAPRQDLDDDLLRHERDRGLWEAFGQLPGACQNVLRLLLLDPPPSYAEVSAALDIPIGSIGPTRARCLDQLRRRLTD